MIRAVGKINEQKLFMIGLLPKDVGRLMDGEPIGFDGAQMESPGVADTHILCVYGSDADQVIERLSGLGIDLSEAKAVVVVGEDAPEPQDLPSMEPASYGHAMNAMREAAAVVERERRVFTNTYEIEAKQFDGSQVNLDDPGVRELLDDIAGELLEQVARAGYVAVDRPLLKVTHFIRISAEAGSSMSILMCSEQEATHVEFAFIVPVHPIERDDAADNNGAAHNGAARSEAQPEDGPPMLIDPDCRDGKCGSCVGGPCVHACHGENEGEA